MLCAKQWEMLVRDTWVSTHIVQLLYLNIGRFIPLNGTSPAIGEVGKFEEVQEERIEVTCAIEKTKSVIAADKSIHPYEEVAYDVYPLLDF